MPAVLKQAAGGTLTHQPWKEAEKSPGRSQASADISK